MRGGVTSSVMLGIDSGAAITGAQWRTSHRGVTWRRGELGPYWEEIEAHEQAIEIMVEAS